MSTNPITSSAVAQSQPARTEAPATHASVASGVSSASSTIAPAAASVAKSPVASASSAAVSTVKPASASSSAAVSSPASTASSAANAASTSAPASTSSNASASSAAASTVKPASASSSAAVSSSASTASSAASAASASSASSSVAPAASAPAAPSFFKRTYLAVCSLVSTIFWTVASVVAWPFKVVGNFCAGLFGEKSDAQKVQNITNRINNGRLTGENAKNEVAKLLLEMDDSSAVLDLLKVALNKGILADQAQLADIANKCNDFSSEKTIELLVVLMPKLTLAQLKDLIALNVKKGVVTIEAKVPAQTDPVKGALGLVRMLMEKAQTAQELADLVKFADTISENKLTEEAKKDLVLAGLATNLPAQVVRFAVLALTDISFNEENKKTIALSALALCANEEEVKLVLASVKEPFSEANTMTLIRFAFIKERTYELVKDLTVSNDKLEMASALILFAEAVNKWKIKADQVATIIENFIADGNDAVDSKAFLNAALTANMITAEQANNIAAMIDAEALKVKSNQGLVQLGRTLYVQERDNSGYRHAAAVVLRGYWNKGRQDSDAFYIRYANEHASADQLANVRRQALQAVVA